MKNKIIIIPSRLSSTRLKNKPLAQIGNKTMVEHVISRAKESSIKNILLAICDSEIETIVKQTGTNYVMTDKDLPSGTDRINQALSIYDSEKKFDIIINLQGDLPDIDPKYIDICANLLEENEDADIATLCFKIENEEDLEAKNVVKAVLSERKDHYKALYFSRSHVPYGGDCYGHIGIYAYTRKSLEKFVKLEASPLEKAEKLEQLRALEADMKIIAKVVDNEPISIDVQKDLEQIRKVFLSKECQLKK